MKKIIIVDDERIIRKGLERSIAWESMGCTVVGTASNGVEGLEMIETLNPDIVLADVKMPQLNGLDMADAALQINPLLKFIIISGYSDFDNVKKAMKLSAVDFIQKPVSDLELTDAISKAKHEIELTHNYHHYVENELLLEVMRGRKSFTLLSDSDLHRNSINIVLIQFNTPWVSHSYFNELHQEAKKLFGQNLFELVICHDDVFALIINSTVLDVEKLRILKKILLTNLKGPLSMGISNSGSINDIKTLYDQSKYALDNKLITGFGRIHEYSEINKAEKSNNTEYLEMKDQYRFLVKHGIFSDIKIFVKKQLTRFNQETDNISLITIISDLHFILVNHLSSRDSLNSISTFSFIDDEHTENLIDRFIDYIQMIEDLTLKENKENNTDNEIREYINNHFKKGLNLSELAETFYLSDSTMSRKIKSIYNKSFSDVLHDLRINEATKMLRESTSTVFDIATKVGYSDYRYFSTVFKKIHGFTPSDYRKRFVNHSSLKW